MHINQNIAVHNKFDFVVTDAITGEVKQKATSYNIVLNQMLTKLTNLNPFFTHINFGTGSGTPVATRTSLFTHLGSRAATLHSTDIKVPIGSITKKITLIASEYVGYTLTEVGIACAAGSTDLVTHSLIKDAEGNPISITKTGTDIITIYATLYINVGDTLFAKGGDGSGNGTTMGTAGGIFSYLFDGASSGPGFQLRLLPGRLPMPRTDDSGYIGYIYNGSPATYTKDLVNYKGTYTFPRVDTGDANKLIRSIAVTSGQNFSYPYHPFHFTLPIPGVWEGFNIANEAVGTGDGVKTMFDFKYDDIKPGTAVIKVDGVPVDPAAVIITPKNGGVKSIVAQREFYSNEYVPECSNGFDFTEDESMFIVGSYYANTSGSTIKGQLFNKVTPEGYFWADQFDGYASSTTTETTGVKILPNKKHVIFASHFNNPVRYWMQSIDPNTGLLTAPRTPFVNGSLSSAVATVFTRDGKYGLSLQSNGNLEMVEIIGPETDNPVIVPKGIVASVGSSGYTSLYFSPDEKFVYSCHNNGYSVRPVDFAAGIVGTAVPVPVEKKGSAGSKISFSQDAKYMCVTKANGGVFLYDPATGLPTEAIDISAMGLNPANIMWLTVSPTNKHVIALGGGTTFFTLGALNEATKRVTYSVSRSSDEFGRTSQMYWVSLAKFNKSGKYLDYSMREYTNEQFRRHEYSETPLYNIEFLTPPAAGAVITADYTTPYIPKTTDYVLDLSMSISFTGV